MRGVHVHWLLNSVAPTLSAEEVRNSSLASIRLRAGALLRCDRPFPITCGREVAVGASVVVVGKIGAEDIDNRSKIWIDAILEAKRAGKTVVLDYTDHHLGFPSVMSGFYAAALKLVDYLVVPSKPMRDLVRRIYDRPITVIPDAIEVGIVDPISNRGALTRDRNHRTALWFGHQSNLPYLLDWLRSLQLAEHTLHLQILTSESGLSFLKKASIVSPTRIQCTGAVWSLHAMNEAASTADFCVIPCGVSDPAKQGASSNRLLTALALGLPTAADPLGSYREFLPYFTELRGPTFQDLVDSPVDFHQIVRTAQGGPVSEHSLRRIGENWWNFVLGVSPLTS